MAKKFFTIDFDGDTLITDSQIPSTINSTRLDSSSINLTPTFPKLSPEEGEIDPSNASYRPIEPSAKKSKTSHMNSRKNPFSSIDILSIDDSSDIDTEDISRTQSAKRRETPGTSSLPSVNYENQNNNDNDDDEQCILEDSEELILRSSTSSVEEVIKSILIMKPERLVQMTQAALWNLQQNLGEAYPKTFKYVKPTQLNSLEKPGVSSHLSAFITVKVIEDAAGYQLISAKKLASIRSMMAYPVKESPENAQIIIRCRDCLSRTCSRVSPNNQKCQGIRCSRCCLSGHRFLSCYQRDNLSWNRRVLAQYNDAYDDSIECRMSLRPRKSSSSIHCILCSKNGHSICGIPELLHREKSCESGDFKIWTKQDILESLPYHVQRQSDMIRWDLESPMELQNPNNYYYRPKRTASWDGFNQMSNH